MNIPRCWAKASQEVTDARRRPFLAQCWRWSDTSVDEARARAREALALMVSKVREGVRLGRYAYGERPLREEIIETITGEGEQPTAIITRNSYGALVLNTAGVMFIDIDFEPEGLIQRLGAALSRLLGRPSGTRQEQHLARLQEWVQAHHGWGMRIYRTKAGLRCLVTHDTFDPAHDSTVELLHSLGADPLYVRLCRSQASFRARLTPKPWRCGVPVPPNRYPWESEGEQQVYRRWQERYQQAAAGFTACRLVAEIGSAWPHPDAAMIQALHDRHACLGDTHRLA